MSDRMMADDGVAICIVTWHSAGDLPGCFEAIAALAHRPLEVIVVDNDSDDRSVELARAFDAVPTTVVAWPQNRGFAAGMNEAFRRTVAPWLLTLNADARPAPDYLDRLLPHLRAGAAVATGRLVRPATEDGVVRLDACGMRLLSAWRHLDRGSGEIDQGQYAQAERVFGATGAASLFARRALADVSTGDAFFDEDFHSFREDAELCFRLQSRDWDVVYEPTARCEHRRTVLPERRATLPAAVNYHSLKNRYLLRLYHQTASNLLRTLIPTSMRDVLALGWVMTRERTSLPAYTWLWRHRRRLWARRRWLAERRTTSVNPWFERDALPLRVAPSGDSS
ncbi:MAG: glycosyltransferase [Acidobacteriota bacterium]